MVDSQETSARAEHPGTPVELERMQAALLRDQGGVLTATRARLARIAHARGIGPSAAEDVVQETLLEAWTHLDRLHSVEGFKPWIDEICRNVCRRADRQRQCDLAHKASTAPHSSLPDTHDDFGNDGVLDNLSGPAGLDPAEELSHRDLIRVLDLALGELPPEARQILELTYVVDLPRDELANKLGISSGALDTRLHRARGNLRKVLNGPLREEAEAFGMALDELADEQWQATRLWCPRCSRRLEGYFLQGEGTNESGPNLHLRCPNCSTRLGRDTVHSMGLVSLAGLHAFRPSWKRVMQGLSDAVLHAISQEWRPCFSCGNPTQFHIYSLQNEMAPSDSAAPFFIRGQCTKCGDCVDTWEFPFPSLDELIYWSHPRTRQFVLEHPKWTSSFGAELEHQGAAALSFHLTDRESSDRLTLLADRHTLRVMTLG